MRQDIDKILDMLRDKTINAAEAEKLIKAIHRVHICEEVKGKAQWLVDSSANVILKAVDFTVMGIEKINPIMKDASSKVVNKIRKLKNKKSHTIDLDLDFMI